MLGEIGSWSLSKDGRIYFKLIYGSGAIDFTLANEPPDDAYIIERANSAPNQLHVYMCPGAPDNMEFDMAPPYVFYSYTGLRIKTEDPNKNWTVPNPALLSPEDVLAMSLGYAPGLTWDEQERFQPVLIEHYQWLRQLPPFSGVTMEMTMEVTMEDQSFSDTATIASSVTLQGEEDLNGGGGHSDRATGLLWIVVSVSTAELASLLPRTGKPEEAEETGNGWTASPAVIEATKMLAAGLK
jgi:hypothetical protein